MVEYTNVLLCNGLGKIGGIETFLYEIGKKYKDLDITVLYNYADINQVRRISKYIRCVRLTDKVKCKKCFLMYKVPIDKIEADEYIQLIHANYKVQDLEVNTDKRITSYYGVSKWVSKDYEDLLRENGIMKKVKTCYNPITVEKPRKILKLISATRLTKEKGKDRMIQLTNELTTKGIPFIWLVFTDDFDKIDNANVIYMKPRLDIRDYIADSDYLVQLSDTEGCPYSPIEANCLGVPVIITPVPSMLELELQGYVLPFDMKDIDVEKLYKRIPKVDYTPPKDIWDKLFVHEKSTYTPSDVIEVETIRAHQYNNQWSFQGQRYFLTPQEANQLIKEGKVREVI